MAIIVPAILEKTKEAFEQKVSLVTKIPGVQKIQIDFADSIFVPNSLLSVLEVDTLNPAFDWEAHLMCKHPMDFLDYQICGFKTLIVHYEAYESEGDLQKAVENIKKVGLLPGICLNLETPVNVFEKFYPNVKHIQLMAIVPGFQGTKYYPEVIERIVNIRKMFPHAIIEIDGGVNETNIQNLKQAGADLLIGGSSVVKAENPAQAFEKLSMLAR